MYLMITSRCNFHCKHCGMSCKKTGMDMTREIWKEAIKLASNYGDITLGGGEPTLHPDFWEILGLSLGSGVEYVWMATNGSQTETALALANLAKKGALGVALSQDIYHDSIDPRVVNAFTKDSKIYNGMGREDNDSREIRNVTGNEIKSGRCKIGKTGCICPDLIVLPNGTIKGCACKDAPIFGNVFDPRIPDFWQSGECSNKQTKGNNMKKKRNYKYLVGICGLLYRHVNDKNFEFYDNPSQRWHKSLIKKLKGFLHPTPLTEKQAIKIMGSMVLFDTPSSK